MPTSGAASCRGASVRDARVVCVSGHGKLCQLCLRGDLMD